MSILDSLFDVLRGWPDDQSVIDESLKPFGAYVPQEGDVVAITNDSGEAKISAATGTRLDDAASVAVLAQRLTGLQQLWMVVGGMDPATDFDGVFTGKATVIRGVFEVRTERYNTGDAYVPGDSVSPAAGVLRANPVGGTDYSQKYGEVLRLDSTRNTLDVSVLS
jgi:hypothetical protein